MEMTIKTAIEKHNKLDALTDDLHDILKALDKHRATQTTVIDNQEILGKTVDELFYIINFAISIIDNQYNQIDKILDTATVDIPWAEDDSPF